MASLGSSRTQVSRLRTIARTCGTSISSLTNVIQNMESYFKGQAAIACKSALERRLNELKKIRSNAEYIAARLSSAIEEIEEEEREERRSRGSGGGGRSSSGGPGMFL